MNIYLAPMEGLTGYIFRGALEKHFGGVDKYFTPFITPSRKKFGEKIVRDIVPEHNEGMRLVPQILTNSAEMFIYTCKALEQYGYTEFNLNLGCPSGTVVSKGRGSGFLACPDELDRFLDGIFKSGYKISVKTRIGMESGDEFYTLLDIYNRYPMEELIIHPRTRADMYKNHPDMEIYGYAEKNSKNTLYYNGDIFFLQDYERIAQGFENTAGVMLGRGAIINPSLPSVIKGGSMAGGSELKAFYEDVRDGWAEVLCGEMPLVHKLKEMLLYMAAGFEGSEKTVKKIKKAKGMSEFNFAAYELFSLK